MDNSIDSDLFLSLDSDNFSDALDESIGERPLSEVLHESLCTHKNNLNVCHINAQSIPAHYTDLLNTFTSNSLHACLVSETFLKPTLPSSLFPLPGFVLLRNDRTGKGGGGVAIYLRKELKYKILSFSPSLYSSSMEHLFIEITVNPSVRFLLGVVYSPPTIDYFNTFEQLLDKYIPQYDEYLIMGDFNTCLIRQDARSRKLLSLTSFFNISILELSPTYHINETHTKLDLILTRDVQRITKFGQLPAPGFSHHDLIYASYKIRIPKPKPKIILQRNLHGMCKDSLKADINSTDWSPLYALDNINDKVEFLSTVITKAYDAHAPLRPVRMKRPPAPWLTGEIRTFMARRDYLYRKNRRNPTPENLSKYKKARNRCNQMIRNAKRRHIYGTINVGTPNNMWKLLHSLGFGRCKTSAGSSVDVNALNRHFSTVPICVDDVTRQETITKLKTNGSTFDYPSFTFTNVGEDRVQRVIYNITSKAVGQDGIGRDLITPILDLLLPHITHIINFSLSSSNFPSTWKRAQIIPIPKKSVTAELKDFRPISILPFLSKVLERIVYIQLSSFLQQNSLLNPFQSGFRPAHGTCTALVQITDDIRFAMDNQKLTLLTLLDFSNAFNCIDHTILLAVLESLNISPSVTQWFGSYLCGRQQRVQIDDKYSNWCEVVAGVPQGGVLSPLLFSVFINTLVSVLRFSSFHLYADDVQLYLSFSPAEFNVAVDMMTEELRAVSTWTHKYGLFLNTSKTQVMVAGNRAYLSKIDFNSAPPVTCNGAPLAYCTEVRNLGLMISQNLSWDQHITETSRKMYGVMHSLKRLKNFLPIPAKITLVKSLLLPHLDYADMCYCDVTEEQLNRLERLLNLCIRYVFGLRKYDHISQYRSQLKWLKIRYRRKYHILCLLFNIMHNPLSPEYLRTRFNPLSFFGRPARSCNYLQLSFPQHNSRFFGDSFTVTSIRLWNALPIEIRRATSVEIFKSKLYQYYLSIQNP